MTDDPPCIYADPQNVSHFHRFHVLFSVDLSSWEQKIHRDAVAERLDGESHEDGAESVLVEHQTDSTLEMSNQELYKDGVLTLGCIGEFYQKMFYLCIFLSITCFVSLVYFHPAFIFSKPGVSNAVKTEQHFQAC